jgi:hypothetical protein
MECSPLPEETDMHTRPRCLAIVPLTLLLIGGCGRTARDRPAPDDDGLAELVLALDAAPSNLGCIIITATSTGRPDPHSLPVSPGQETRFVLKRLPVGVVVLTVDAFASSCAAAAGTVPRWVGGPVSVTLAPGANGPVDIQMRRNTELSVNVGFDPAPDPRCAPAGSACLIDGDCCSGNQCAIEGDGGAIGQCKPVVMNSPSIALALAGEHHYLLYSSEMGPGCMDPGASTSWFRVNDAETTCVLSDVPVVVVPVVALDLCSVSPQGGQCTPCLGDPRCKLSSCFPEAHHVPPGSDCPGTKITGLTGLNDYLVLRKPDLTSPPARPDELPRLLTVAASDNVKAVAPAAHASFVKAALATEGLPPEMAGDRCGGGGLCGVVPYARVTAPVAGFSFTSSFALSSSPLF